MREFLDEGRVEFRPPAAATPGAARMAVRRTDASIRDEIVGELNKAPWLDADGVMIAVNRGEVLLEGKVPEPRIRTALCQIAARCRGVRALHDRLEVAAPRHLL